MGLLFLNIHLQYFKELILIKLSLFSFDQYCHIRSNPIFLPLNLKLIFMLYYPQFM